MTEEEKVIISKGLRERKLHQARKIIKGTSMFDRFTSLWNDFKAGEHLKKRP